MNFKENILQQKCYKDPQKYEGRNLNEQYITEQTFERMGERKFAPFFLCSTKAPIGNSSNAAHK